MDGGDHDGEGLAMFCSACGAKVRDTDSLCWKCGARVGAPDDGEDNEPNDNVSVVQGKAGQIPPLIKARCNQAKPLNARVPRRQAAHPVPILTSKRDVCESVCWGSGA